uniref:TAFII28-like protein domain-containing protein n=1 Tax=Rhizochromulina marina TaxID=1034831 RepID=A0A7S2RRH9_9STRA|mmetsp:Transcript_19955/g.58286  ORF Transcript_19955/g.58286 Transcript_19955/m.58286 type:complete len:267 (+) Transcript_19955:55-855(+)
MADAPEAKKPRTGKGIVIKDIGAVRRENEEVERQEREAEEVAAGSDGSKMRRGAAVDYDAEYSTLEAALMKHEIDLLDDEQLERYEHFRRSHFGQDAIKQVIQEYFSQTFGQGSGSGAPATPASPQHGRSGHRKRKERLEGPPVLASTSSSSSVAATPQGGGSGGGGGASHGTMKCVMKPEMLIMLSGLAKLYVGNITQTARAVMEERGETGGLRPHHIREAYQRVRQSQGGDFGGLSGSFVDQRASTERLLHGGPGPLFNDKDIV